MMQKLLPWALWVIALAALIGAVHARMQQVSAEPNPNACKTPIYWESPLLK
ncbi:MAG: hypothetical protein NZ550_01285 [Fimbriimonadales bacterium]|nr:hypothetical protein [Fimbriimonadales bacterium]MDW8051446.1 hypothetical protein [Armatimonadota bacterium]